MATIQKQPTIAVAALHESGHILITMTWKNPDGTCSCTSITLTEKEALELDNKIIDSLNAILAHTKEATDDTIN